MNHSQSKKNSGVSQIYDAVYETCLLFCPILNNVEYSTYSGVNPDYSFHKNPCSGDNLFYADSRTNEKTDRQYKANLRFFSTLRIAPKTHKVSCLHGDED